MPDDDQGGSDVQVYCERSDCDEPIDPSTFRLLTGEDREGVWRQGYFRCKAGHDNYSEKRYAR